MKKMVLFLILSFLGLCLCSCGNSEKSVNLDHIENQEDESEEQPEINTDLFEENIMDYEVDDFAENEEMTEYTGMNVDYVKIMNEGWNTSKVHILRSIEELAQFYEKYKFSYGMEERNFGGQICRDESFYRQFNPEISKYNQEFFLNTAVVIRLINEPSSFIRHRVMSCQIGIKNMVMKINRYVPSMVTCDVASWLICIEIEKNLIESCSNVKVNINTINYGS